MRKYQVTTKTREQIAAVFAAVFKTIKPADAPKPVTQAERLAPYRPDIMKQRRRGLTWKQIADGMADPRINEKVSARLLKKLFGSDDPAKKLAAAAAQPAVPARSAAAPAPSPATAPKPPSRRYILDPLTGLPITE